MATVKHSTFFLTINTNVPTTATNAKQITLKFKRVLSVIFNPKNIPRFLKVLDGNEKGLQTIKSIDGEYVIEEGPVQQRIHAHATVNVTHESVLLYNIDALREKVNTALGRKTHIHVAALHNPVRSLESYMRKQAQPITSSLTAKRKNAH